MITGRDVYEGYPTDALQPPYSDLSKEERAGYQQTAKEVNEGIWKTRVDTLAAILGDVDGAVAITTRSGITTTVEQCTDTANNNPCWIHYDSFDNVRLVDYKFENMAGILPDVNEPIWMRA